MITRLAPLSQLPEQACGWQQSLRQAFRKPEDLLRELGLEEQIPLLPDTGTLPGAFPFLVTREYASRMQHGKLHDPLLRQVLPLAEEAEAQPGFVADPVGDLASRPAEQKPDSNLQGVLHKYQGRVLLIGTGACAIHCRYCFRRHFPYASELAARNDWHDAVAYIAANPDVEEVILSGGDPLLLSTLKLRRLTEQLALLPHIRSLRIHSRLPVVLPGRIDAEFMDWWGGLPWRTTMVIHANHPKEFDASVGAALTTLRRHSNAVLNQAVLLRGVNDDVDTLAALASTGYDSGVLPYYLHLLDRVQGAAHFMVSDRRARALLKSLREQLPGYLVFRAVREQAGAAYKIPLF